MFPRMGDRFRRIAVVHEALLYVGYAAFAVLAARAWARDSQPNCPLH